MHATAEDLAADPGTIDEATGDAPEMPPIAGSGEQLTLNVGGAKVTSSEFKLTGGSIPLEGEFKKGELIALRVECRVGEIAFEDTVDPHGQVTKTVRRHKARLEGVTRI